MFTSCSTPSVLECKRPPHTRHPTSPPCTRVATFFFARTLPLATPAPAPHCTAPQLSFPSRPSFPSLQVIEALLPSPCSYARPATPSPSSSIRRVPSSTSMPRYCTAPPTPSHPSGVLHSLHLQQSECSRAEQSRAARLQRVRKLVRPMPAFLKWDSSSSTLSGCEFLNVHVSGVPRPGLLCGTFQDVYLTVPRAANCAQNKSVL